jgi:hypothetical protein
MPACGMSRVRNSNEEVFIDILKFENLILIFFYKRTLMIVVIKKTIMDDHNG